MFKLIKNYKLYSRENTLYIDSCVSLSLWDALKKQEHFLTQEHIKDLKLKESGFKRLRFSSKLHDTAKARDFLESHYEELILRYIQEGNENFTSLFLDFTQEAKTRISFYADFLIKQSSGLKSSTKTSINNSVRLILEFFKNRSIKGIESEDVLEFYSFLEQRLQPSSIKICISVAKRIFDCAVKDKVIATNPIFNKKFSHQLKPQINPFTEEEIMRLLQAKEDIGLYLKIALLTGARKGEILALQFKDLDFIHKKIHIYKAVCSISGKLITPKTRSSTRSIDMLPFLEKELLKAKELKKDEDFIFTDEKGKRITHFYHSHLRTQYLALLKHLNISYRTIYSTRHSFASLMLSKNEPLLWVSAMLGHNNSQTTLQKYAQYIPSKEVKHAQFLDAITLEEE